MADHNESEEDKQGGGYVAGMVMLFLLMLGLAVWPAKAPPNPVQCAMLRPER